MPTRILRDWTDSEPVNQLSADGERTFTRIIMKADDYGRLTANPKLLRPLLYPLLLDQVREADLQRWMNECATAGLVRFYSVEGKQYMSVVKFQQRMRNSRPKHPPPPWKDDPPQVAASCGDPPQVAASRGELRPDSESDSEAGYGGEKSLPLPPYSHSNGSATSSGPHPSSKKATAMTWQTRNGHGKTPGSPGTAEGKAQDLLVRLVKFSGAPTYLPLFQKALRSLGPGRAEEALGEVRMRCAEGTVEHRGRYLVALLTRWMAETGV
jgi:hypothetical protein